MDIKSVCILVCAGSSSRMGDLSTAKSKVLLNLEAEDSQNIWTVLDEVISRMALAGVENIIIVCPDKLSKDFHPIVSKFPTVKCHLESGGPTRSHSVRNGLNAISSTFPDIKHEIVLVHDGARPFFNVQLLKDSIQQVILNNQGCIFAVPATSTIKVCDNNLKVQQTLARDNLWEIQTPQIFPKDILLEAYESENLSDSIFDDSSLVERLPYPVSVVRSCYSNFKITTKEDIDRAKLIFSTNKLLSL